MSEDKVLGFTLSRAHKITERIVRQINDKVSDIGCLINPIMIHSDTDLVNVDMRLEKIKTVRENLSNLYSILGELRIKIAEANAKYGLNSLLTEKKDVIREKKHLEEILQSVSHANGSAHNKNQVESLLIRLSTTNSMSGVRTIVADESITSCIEKDISDLTHRSDSLSDKISDINASKKISISIQVDILHQLGL